MVSECRSEAEVSQGKAAPAWHPRIGSLHPVAPRRGQPPLPQPCRPDGEREGVWERGWVSSGQRGFLFVCFLFYR